MIDNSLEALKKDFTDMQDCIFDKPTADAGKTYEWILYLEAMKRDKIISRSQFNEYKFTYLQPGEIPPATSEDTIPEMIKQISPFYK